MTQNLRDSAYNLCRYITSCDFRNEVKSALESVTYTKDGDESNRSMIGYYARQHSPQGDQFKNYLMIARDQHTYEPPVKFPNWDFSLLPQEAMILSMGHNTLKHINKVLVAEINKHFPNLSNLLDVYGDDVFNMPGCSDEVFPIDEKIIKDLIDKFRNTRAVQKLYESDREALRRISPSVLNHIIILEEKIGSSDMSAEGLPEDIVQMIMSINSSKFEGKILSIILILISIRAILKTLNQLAFQSFYIDKIITIDQDSVYRYEDLGSNVVCRYGNVSYQLSGGERLLHPREIFLLTIKTKARKVKELAIAGGMQIRFGGDHGESVDLSAIFLDSDLNPYSTLVR